MNELVKRLGYFGYIFDTATNSRVEAASYAGIFTLKNIELGTNLWNKRIK